MTTTKTTPDLSVVRTEHPHATRMREAFAAFERGDLDAVLENMADDYTWKNEGSSPVAGIHEGREGVRRMFLQLFTLTEGTFKTTPLSIFADDARAVAVYDATATTNGQTMTLRWVIVDEMNSDGLVSSTHCFCYDQQTADANLVGAPQQG